jgi:hypothetical protein
MSPAARTLQALRASGYVAGVVERYIFQTKTRVDLFGCVDIIAARRGQPILAVQATTLAAPSRFGVGICENGEGRGSSESSSGPATWLPGSWPPQLAGDAELTSRASSMLWPRRRVVSCELR